MKLTGINSGIFVLFTLFLLSGYSWADTLVMKDGSVLMGEILSQEKNTLKFKTSYAGTLKIKWDQVKTFQTDKTTTIMLVTDELVKTHYVSNADDGLTQVKKKGEEWKTAFKTKNVTFINPEPWRLGNGYSVTGKANLSLKSQRGNTIKDEFEMDGRLMFRSLEDRYTFTGILENDTNNKKQTADNWLFSGKYDYFVSKKRYYGIGLSFERDRFTDLDLRTTIGPHVGRQFYESKALNLRVEAGIAKVYENNIETDDHDYLAFNWYGNYDHFLFNDLTQFYHEQRGIWDMEKSDKVTINSWTGFRFPLQFGIVASAELELEYDSQPNDGIDKTDRTYRLKIGYQW
jgi:putative salt-induced outer membrane protein YdiY